MTWMRYIFDENRQSGARVKTHVVHGDLATAILADYLDQGERIAPDRQIYKGIEPVTDACLEMGGPCFVDRPWETFQIDGLACDIPSGELEMFHNEWLRLPERSVAAGTPTDPVRRLPYFKLKGSHCLVLPPALHRQLMIDVQARLPIATENERRFMATKGQTPSEVIGEANAMLRTKPGPITPLPRRPKPFPRG